MNSYRDFFDVFSNPSEISLSTGAQTAIPVEVPWRISLAFLPGNPPTVLRQMPARIHPEISSGVSIGIFFEVVPSWSPLGMSSKIASVMSCRVVLLLVSSF